jgi:hypothetical protein
MIKIRIIDSIYFFELINFIRILIDPLELIISE